MNNETILKNTIEMVKLYCNEINDVELAKKVLADPHYYATTYKCVLPFIRLASSIIIEAQEGINAKTTSKTIISAIKKTLAPNDKRPIYQYLIEQDGKFHACDGYRAIRLIDDIPCLPHLPEEMKAINAMDFAKLFQPLEAAATKENIIELPTIAELKTFIETYKPRGREAKWKTIQPYIIKNVIAINPLYLLDMMQALPGCIAYKTGDPSQTKPLYFTAENGDGLILPVRIENWKLEKGNEWNIKDEAVK